LPKEGSHQIVETSPAATVETRLPTGTEMSTPLFSVTVLRTGCSCVPYREMSRPPSTGQPSPPRDASNAPPPAGSGAFVPGFGAFFFSASIRAAIFDSRSRKSFFLRSTSFWKFFLSWRIDARRFFFFVVALRSRTCSADLSAMSRCR
jgi:hypothetical protein